MRFHPPPRGGQCRSVDVELDSRRVTLQFIYHSQQLIIDFLSAAEERESCCWISACGPQILHHPRAWQATRCSTTHLHHLTGTAIWWFWRYLLQSKMILLLSYELVSCCASLGEPIFHLKSESSPLLHRWEIAPLEQNEYGQISLSVRVEESMLVLQTV